MRSTIVASVALLALVLVGSAFAQTSIGSQIQFQASANVTLSSDLEAKFAYRYVNFADLSIPTVAQRAFWVSIASQATANGAGGSLTTDSLVGSAYVELGSFPTNWLASYSTNGTFDANVLGFDASKSANFIFSAYPMLIEKNAAGLEVKKYSLAGKLTLLDLTKSLSWEKVESSTDGDVKYLVVKGTDSKIAGFSITFTFIVSTKLGYLEYGKTFVHPRSMETVVEIRGWPYAEPTNTLSLVVYAGSGSAAVDATGFVSAATNSQVYVKFSGRVMVEGKDNTVKLGAWADVTFNEADFPQLSGLKTQLDGRFKSGYSIKRQEVTFPAGANVIIYDPTVGEGQPINSAATNVISMIALAALALLAVMFM